MTKTLTGFAPLAILAWGGGVFAVDPFSLQATLDTFPALATLALVIGPSLFVVMLASRLGTPE